MRRSQCRFQLSIPFHSRLELDLGDTLPEEFERIRPDWEQEGFRDRPNNVTWNSCAVRGTLYATLRMRALLSVRPPRNDRRLRGCRHVDYRQSSQTMGLDNSDPAAAAASTIIVFPQRSISGRSTDMNRFRLSTEGQYETRLNNRWLLHDLPHRRLLAFCRRRPAAL